MENLKAIKTMYKGIEFRSKLEAQWAVFFDACGADWLYEPEGFELPDGTWYIPDFLLRGVGGRVPGEGDLWIEVKGVMTDEDWAKVKAFPMPIEVFGNIPAGEDFWDIASSLSDMFYRDNRFFGLECVDGDYYPGVPIVDRDGKFCIVGEDNNYLRDADENFTRMAYAVAINAKFDHGQRPVTEQAISDELHLKQATFNEMWQEIKSIAYSVSRLESRDREHRNRTDTSKVSLDPALAGRLHWYAQRKGLTMEEAIEEAVGELVGSMHYHYQELSMLRPLVQQPADDKTDIKAKYLFVAKGQYASGYWKRLARAYSSVDYALKAIEKERKNNEYVNYKIVRYKRDCDLTEAAINEVNNAD